METSVVYYCSAPPQSIAVYHRSHRHSRPRWLQHQRIHTRADGCYWKLSSREVSYQDIGDSIADSCTIIIAIHSSCASNVEPITLKTPPSVTPKPIGAFVWEPFNRIEHSLSHGRDDREFDNKKMITTIPKPVASAQSRGIMIKYHLHRADSDATILAGSSILSSGGLCPPFESCPNRNLFQQFFGIEFIHKGHTHVRAISTYEFARCFGLVESIQYRLSHEKHKFGLDASMPGRTSAWLFEQIHSHLVYLRNANSEVFSPNQYAAPAATIQTLISGAICTRLPSKECWVQAYANNSELCAVRELALNPSLINNQTLSKGVGPSMVQLVRGLLLESLVRGSNPLVGAPHV